MSVEFPSVNSTINYMDGRTRPHYVSISRTSCKGRIRNQEIHKGLENGNQTEARTVYLFTTIGSGWQQFQPVMKIAGRCTELPTVSKSWDITVLMLQYPCGFRFKLSYVYPRRHALLGTSWCRVAADRSDKSRILQVSFHFRLPLRPTLHLNLTAFHGASEAQSLSFHIRNQEANQLRKSCNPIIHLQILRNVRASPLHSLAIFLVTNANINLPCHKHAI
jgi:hypothetical protein